MHTVVETPTYLAAAEALFSEAERAEIVTMVAADPECGMSWPEPEDFGRFVLLVRGEGKAPERGSYTFTAMTSFRFS
jgi:hypothetical protein